MPTNDNVLRQIELIVNDGQNVLEIIPSNGGESRFYIFTSWEPSLTSSSTSIDYLTFTAVAIDQFIYVARDVQHPTIFLQSLLQFLKVRNFVVLKFNKTMDYITYVPH
jgi:hypothetical protein